MRKTSAFQGLGDDIGLKIVTRIKQRMPFVKMTINAPMLSPGEPELGGDEYQEFSLPRTVLLQGRLVRTGVAASGR